MKFFSFASFALAAFTGFVAAIDPTTVMDNIKNVTTMSANANQMVSNIDFLNALFQGPQVGVTLGNIANTVKTDIQAMQADPNAVFSDNYAKDIVVVLTTFVQVHQELLSTIIGKHGILSLFGFTAPVATGLRGIEAVVDAFATALIMEIPTEAPAAMNQTNSLDISIKAAITVYSS